MSCAAYQFTVYIGMSLVHRVLKVSGERCQGALLQLQNCNCLRFDILQIKWIFSPL